MKVRYRELLPSRSRSWLRSLVVECGAPDCRGFHLSHPVLPRLPGIFLDQTWYCSPGCLEGALRRRVESQLGAAITDLRHTPRMPFRLILLAGGRVSEAQLAHARGMQAASLGDGDLGDALIQLGFSTEDEVAAARAAEAGCLFFNGAAQPVQAEYAMPLSWMHHYRAWPVHYAPATGRLLIGFVYRVHSSLLQAVEQVTGCRTEACMMTASAWQLQLANLPPLTFPEIQETASSQHSLVRMIVQHAIESGADKVRMGMSGDSMWVRLTGGSQTRDLIIHLVAETAQGLSKQQAGGTGSQGAIEVPGTRWRVAQKASIPTLERKRASL